MYLLQLVQALKYENFNDIQGGLEPASKRDSQGGLGESSTLGDLERSATSNICLFLRQLKGREKQNAVIIYSPSSCSQCVYISLFCHESINHIFFRKCICLVFLTMVLWFLTPCLHRT